MEDHHNAFFFSSETKLLGSSFDEQDGHSYEFDTIIRSFDQGFNDIMLFETRFMDIVFDSGQGLPLELAGMVASALNLSIAGNAAACGGRLDSCDKNTSKGNSKGSAMKPARWDHLKTLLLERMRRGQLKDRLYELQSLVPNINKALLKGIHCWNQLGIEGVHVECDAQIIIKMPKGQLKVPKPLMLLTAIGNAIQS